MTASDAPARRFYADVAVAADEASGGWRVTLDGRGVKTPGRRDLIAPHRRLAEALAAEWAAQSDVIDPTQMPATRLANTACDHAGAHRDGLVGRVLEGASTDLTCCLATAPAELRARQEHEWGPLRVWAADTLAVRLDAAEGLFPPAPGPESLAALRAAVLDMDDFALTALVHGVGLAGSVIIMLAFARGRLTARGAFAASRIDEDFQTERWGADAEADARADAIMAEFSALTAFFPDAMAGEETA